MASSPPAPTHLNLPNPKKRPSTGPPPQPVNTPGYPSQAAKRPKHQHPLRQTSFPASESPAGIYTPNGARSETGSVSASLVSGTTGSKRSRGRPKKRKGQADDAASGRGVGGSEYDDGDDDENNHQEATTSGNLSSLNDNNAHHQGRRNRGGGAKSVISGTGTGGPSGVGAVAEDDDDDANAPLADPNSDESRRLHAELAKEKEHIAQLQEALTPDQMQRYTSYLRTKLKGATLKRIVNQTVSQSVTANPLQAVQWVGKVFVGEIVELARVVQAEWASSWEAAKLENDDETDRGQHQHHQHHQRQDNHLENGKSTTATTAATTPVMIINPTTTKDLYNGANPHRGGLLPDHLREAVRRYKADGEGGGTGFGGYSFGNLGVKGEAVPRLGMGSARARRLFG